MIRTLQVENGQVSVHSGSGIVIGSEPENEWNEAGHKAQAMLEAATGPTASDGFTKDSGSVSRHGSWQPMAPPGQVSAKVLLVDNYDSFIHNLADYCAALGAEVTVVRCDENLEQRRVSGGFTHVILGPGPGRPDEAGNLLSFTKAVLGKIPVLGICLGHQALAEATGATISVANKPVHGEVELIHHDGRGIHSGISGPFEATRYHSLIVDEMSLPDNWNITARLEDGTVMAMQHKDCPAIGLQYHPESIGTDEGRGILFRFLSTV